MRTSSAANGRRYKAPSFDLRKVRWSRVGMGKRGGSRVIYFNRLASGEVVLVATYAKPKFDNMPIAVLKMWKEAYDG